MDTSHAAALADEPQQPVENFRIGENGAINGVQEDGIELLDLRVLEVTEIVAEDDLKSTSIFRICFDFRFKKTAS